MEKAKTKKGFSIPEVIVAISIVILIIVTATNLLVSSQRANRRNINQIIAYNLAQEALEGIRNVRDGYWLHNQYWRGEKGIFGSDFQDEEGYYIIDKKHNLLTKEGCRTTTSEQSRLLNNIGTVISYAPWELNKLNSPNDDQSKIYIVEEGDIKRYTHSPIGNDSGFRRWLEIQTVPYQIPNGDLREDLKMAVTAVVEWEEQSIKMYVRIPAIFTDWKAGPL